MRDAPILANGNPALASRVSPIPPTVQLSSAALWPDPAHLTTNHGIVDFDSPRGHSTARLNAALLHAAQPEQSADSDANAIGRHDHGSDIADADVHRAGERVNA